MIKRLYSSFLLLLILLASFGFAEEGCKQLIKDSMYKINHLDAGGKGVYFEYVVYSRVKGDGKTEMKERSQIKMVNGKSFFTSKRADIYKDSKYQVAVLKDQKTIFIAEVGNDGFSKMKLENIMLLQDSMLKKSKISGCDEALLNKKKVKKIILTPDNQTKKQKGLQLMTFWINTPESSLSRMKMDYLKDGKNREVEMEVLQANYDYKGSIFSSSALEMVLNKEDKLLPAYSSYQLSDIRKMKSK